MPQQPAEPSQETSPSDEFARAASSRARHPVVELASDFVQFLKEEKKWWLIPILLSLALIAIVALLLQSPAAPFIYPLF